MDGSDNRLDSHSHSYIHNSRRGNALRETGPEDDDVVAVRLELVCRHGVESNRIILWKNTFDTACCCSSIAHSSSSVVLHSDGADAS